MRPMSTSVPVTTMPARALNAPDTTHALRARPLAERQLARAAWSEVEADRIPTRHDLHRLAVLSQLHVALAEVHAQALAAERLGAVDRVLEDHRRALPAIQAYVRGGGGGHPQHHPFRGCRL